MTDGELLDHLVGTGEERGRDRQAEHFGSLALQMAVGGGGGREARAGFA